MSITRRLAALALGFFISIAASAGVTIEGDPKVAFIYFSPKNDGGWTESHERGRANAAKALGLDLAYVENVPETTEGVRQVVDLYLDRGFNIIIGTSYGFGDGLLEAAKANPNVAFMNAAGETASENLETFYARTYEPWYLAGMAAGAVSKSNKIGIVAGFPISVVNWDVNAFTRGARSVNPAIEVIATFANSWYDPVKEKQAAEAMLEQGADVIACNMSSTAVVVAAEAAGAYSVGFQNDMSAAGPNGHLTSVVFNWENYYIDAIKRMSSPNWVSEGLPLAGMEIALADITPLSDAVPQKIRDEIAQVRQSMSDGSFSPYSGPVTKQNGEVAVPAGSVMDDGGLWGMNYFVEGVIGTMPD